MIYVMTILMLFSENGELGFSNPTSLLHSLWFFNTVFFGLLGITEHHQMRWMGVKLCNDNKGDEYILMMEYTTKPRTDTDIRNQRDSAESLGKKDDPSRCPVAAYKLYRSKRPINIAIQMIHFIFNKTPILRNLHYGSSPNMLGSTNLASS